VARRLRRAAVPRLLPRAAPALLQPVLAPLRLRPRWAPLRLHRPRRLRRRRSSFVNQLPAASPLWEAAPAVSSLRVDWLQAGWTTALSLHLDVPTKAGPLPRPGFFVGRLQRPTGALKMLRRLF
jgi:hypothetical protein